LIKLGTKRKIDDNKTVIYTEVWQYGEIGVIDEKQFSYDSQMKYVPIEVTLANKWNGWTEEHMKTV